LEEEGVHRLFFELASESRLAILHELQKKDLKTKAISQRLDLTETETFRQLQRLNEASLVEKLSEGPYRLTGYARLVLDHSASMEFISEHRQYFLEHDTSLLPREFRARIDELSGSRFIASTVETVNKMTEIFRGAQKRLDAVVMGVESLVETAKMRAHEGVSERWLIHDKDVPEASSILGSWQRLPEVRTMPRVLGYIVVSDRAALLTIRRNDGKMSYESFFGEGDSFRKWAGDLFAEEWQKARPWRP
jgi:predicted transcriptional regulator